MLGLRTLKQTRHEERPDHSGIAQYFGKTSPFVWWHELSPGHAFLIRTAAQPSPIIRFRTNAHAVVETRRLDAEPQSHVADLDVRSHLLRPVPRDSAANRKDAEPLGRCDVRGVTVEILVRIERGEGLVDGAQDVQI